MDIFKQKILKKLIHTDKFKIFLALIFFLGCGLYITFPLIFNLSNLIFDKVDDTYITWIINWDIHSFSINIMNIFNGNVFYPYHNTLAYSDIYLTSAILGFIPTKIFGNPAIAYNFNIIFAFISLGFCSYLLAYYITRDHLASVAGGVIAAFSPYVTTKIMHLQLLEICWVPLAILFFLMFLDKKSYKYLVISSIFFLIQVYNSFLPGYFIVFSCIFLIIYYFYKKRITIKDLPISKMLFTALFVFILTLPVIIPYYQVANEFKYVRDIRDSIQFANRPEYTLYPGFTTKLTGILLNTFYKYDKGPFTYDGFIGLAFFALSASALLYRFFKRKKKWFLFDIFSGVGFFGFILSLGPVLQWGGHVIKHPFMIPLPYALFYYLIPGFNGLRNSARWEMLFLISFSICIAIFLSAVFKNKRFALKAILIFIICLEVLWEFNFPYKFSQIPVAAQFPKVYFFINSLPKNSVIVEFPIFNWNTYIPLNDIETTREYYSTLGYWKTFNGGAGFDPPPWQNKVTFLANNFPNRQSIVLLKTIPVGYIVLHKDQFDMMHNKQILINGKLVLKGEEIKTNLEKNTNLSLVYSDKNSSVYKINR